MRTKQADQLQACTSTQSPEHMSAKYVSAKITEKLKHCTTLLVSVFCSSPHRAVLTLRSPLGSNTAGRPKIPVLAGSVQKQKKKCLFRRQTQLEMPWLPARNIVFFCLGKHRNVCWSHTCRCQNAVGRCGSLLVCNSTITLSTSWYESYDRCVSCDTCRSFFDCWHFFLLTEL